MLGIGVRDCRHTSEAHVDSVRRCNSYEYLFYSVPICNKLHSGDIEGGKRRRGASAEPEQEDDDDVEEEEEAEGLVAAGEGGTLPSHLLLILDELLPSWHRQYPSARLQLIRSQTQTWWREYVHEFVKGPVRLLVIAEAAPWRRAGEPTYVYKPNDDEYDGGIIGALVGGVGAAEGGDVPTFTKKDAIVKAAALQYLGSRGVLLVDPLPLSLDYTGRGAKHSNLRNKAAYTQAARAGWEEVIALLSAAGVELHERVVVGFTLLKSARALTLEHGEPRPLQLPGGRVMTVLPREHTFTTRAGYPDAKVLAKMLARTPLP